MRACKRTLFYSDYVCIKCSGIEIDPDKYKKFLETNDKVNSSDGCDR